MTTDRHPVPEHESLSALFDGELHGDAARFALRRLGHDAAWQDTCGRWQLIGDALRGQATAAASSGLAGRVAASVATEPVPTLQAAPAARPAARAWRGWAGGALAASVAAALFIARPFQADDAASPAVPAVAQAAAPVLVQEPRVAVADAVAPPARDEAVASVAPVRDAAPAQRPAVRQFAVARNRPARSRSREAVRPSPVTQAPATVLAAQAAPVDPFRPPMHGNGIVTRPWPRAVLPGTAANALTTGFDAAQSPSFYPFEPPVTAPHVTTMPGAVDR